MIAPFNKDMGQRLSDLHRAASAGDAIKAEFHPGFDHGQSNMPDRIILDIEPNGRRMVFDMPTAEALAAQLQINGMSETAGLIRQAMPDGATV